MTDDDLRAMVAKAPWIARTVARQAGAMHIADELEGAALVGLARAHATWDPKAADCEPQSYAYHLMRFAALDAARAWLGRRRGRLEASDVESVDTSKVYDPADADNARDELAAVGDSLALMTPLMRDALLCYARGESQSDVAERYGVTSSRVSQVRQTAILRHVHGVRSSTSRDWSKASD